MAAVKPAVDNAVNERRLRPIYDCLDNGNNKKALQEAAKLLKKQENFLCAKVLKALALIRLGRQDDSLCVLQEVHQDHPADESTLQAMTICYWELHKPELIADAYENASKKDPLNEEFLTHLFMAYVRLGEHKKQQQTAMLLYKVKPKNPYYFWAVMSVVMQARSSDEKLAKTMFLPLAQKMTEKLVNSGKIEAEAEVELYLMILNLQEKYEEALKVLEGPLAEHLKSCTTLPQRRASLLTQLERWPDANAAYKNLLLQKPDNWAFYKGYFSSLFKIMEQKWQADSTSKDFITDENACEASDFILAQINREGSERLRGPFLARMEFLKLLQLHGQGSNAEKKLAGSFPELLMEYFEKFGSKMCCFSDLKPYIDHASDSEKKKFLELLEENFGFKKDNNRNLPSDAKEMQFHIAYVQLCRYLNQHSHMLTNLKFELVENLMNRYRSSLKFMDGLPTTDVHPGNDYCILSVHVLIDIWEETHDDSILLRAIAYLEWGLVQSPLSHQFKFLLIKLYHKVGAVVPAYYKYNSMDIKHIQLDTVGYIITRYLTSLSYYSAACTVYGNTLRFFTSNYRDTIDYLISSYKFGSFNKIYEFVQFRERLNNSQQFGKIITERMILDLIVDTYCHEATEQVVHFMGIEPEKDKIFWETLQDNRDLDIMCSWDSNSDRISRTQSCQDEIKWLKLRQLTVRCIAACILLTKSMSHHQTPSPNDQMTNGVKGEVTNTLQCLLDQLSSHIETLNISKSKSKWSLTGPYDSRLLLYMKDGHPAILLEFLNLVLKLHMSDQKVNEDNNELLITSELSNKLKDLTSQCINSGESLVNPSQWSEFLEGISNLVETFSFILIIVGCYQRILKPHKVSLSRKGKKRNRENVPARVSETLKNFENIVSILEHSIKELHQFITKIKFDRLTEQLSSLKVSLTKDITSEELLNTYNVIQGNIRESYETSLKELGDLVQHKIKYLSSVKL